MKKEKYFLLGCLALMLFTVSCEKEKGGSGTKAVFSYIADGIKVNFTNFSTGSTEYVWDFGDQSPLSVQSNPVHIFTQKGKFLVSLTAKNGADSSVFIDTVLISGPNIKIDGDFTDWAYVEYTHINEPGTGGTLQAVKTFASAGYLNFYVEGNADFNFAVIDLYLDTDNNAETGLKSWMYPVASGADFLCEGNVNQAEPAASSGDVFAHVGPGNDWSWNGISPFAGVLAFSKMVTKDGKKIIEFSIKRDGLGKMNKQVNFAIVESNSGWTEVGAIPADQTPESKFATIPL